MKSQMKIATRLTILFLLTAVVPTVIVGYMGYHIGKRIILRETTNHLVSVNVLKSRELKRWVESCKISIEELAQRPLVVQYAAIMAATHMMQNFSYREAHENIVEDHFNPRLKYGIFTELFIMCSPYGHISASTNMKQDGKYRNNRRYFIEGQSRTYVEGSFYSPTLEQPSMIVSTPVKDKNGYTVAVLAGRVDLNELSEIMKIQSGKSQTLNTYLVNSFNYFVSEPRFGEDYILKKTIHTKGTEAGLSGKEGIGFYNGYREIPVIGAYKWLPEFRMCIITEIEQSEAFASVEQLAWIVVSSILFVLTIAVFMGMFFARTISLPLIRLAKGAQEIGRGNLEYKVGTTSKDEIGELSRAFDRMTQELQKTTVSRDAFLQERDFSDSVINSLPGIFYLFDENGRFYRWNKNFEIVTKYSAEEISQMSPLALFTGEDKQHIANKIQDVFIKGDDSAEATLVTKGGKKIPYYFTGIRNIIGGRIFLVGVGIDVTELRQAEEEIRKLNAELEQRVVDRTAQLEAANKELEAFSYSVSHDLRGPLQHVTGFSELLNKRAAGILDEKNRHYLKVISDSTVRMGRLIDDLLSFSRMGRMEMLKKKTNLDSLVKEILREYRDDSSGRNIDWKVGLLPEVYGDSAMLRQVFVNLISNACKYTGKCDKAEIEIGSLCGENGEMCIFVKDNGAGFDMKYVDKLFGLFQRLHRTEDYEGTGVGLANVRRIIHRHGGRVWAEGEVGKGATFYFTLSA